MVPGTPGGGRQLLIAGSWRSTFARRVGIGDWFPQALTNSDTAFDNAQALFPKQAEKIIVTAPAMLKVEETRAVFI